MNIINVNVSLESKVDAWPFAKRGSVLLILLRKWRQF